MKNSSKKVLFSVAGFVLFVAYVLVMHTCLISTPKPGMLDFVIECVMATGLGTSVIVLLGFGSYGFTYLITRAEKCYQGYAKNRVGAA